jgi:hypothetical protein
MNLKNFIKQTILKNIVTGDINKNNQDGVFHRVWGYIATNQIYGDYLEFGVYKGDTLISSYDQYCLFRHWMKLEIESNEKWRKQQIEQFYDFHPIFYGYDSFEGIPTNNEDETIFNKGTYSMSEERVKQNLLNKKVNLTYFRIIKSHFSDLNIKKIPHKASVIHIDGDLYESAKLALNLCKDAIQQGTVVLFDDYNCFSSENSKGERRALLEFSKETKIKFEPWFSYRFVGQAFICHIP